MKYAYVKRGKKTYFEFPLGKAPQSFKGYRKIVEVPAIHFGQGFSRCNIPPKLEPKITSKTTMGKMTRTEYDAI